MNEAFFRDGGVHGVLKRCSDKRMGSCGLPFDVMSTVPNLFEKYREIQGERKIAPGELKMVETVSHWTLVAAKDQPEWPALRKRKQFENVWSLDQDKVDEHHQLFKIRRSEEDLSR